MKRYLATILALVATCLFAQSQPPTNVCQEDPSFKDWDFWLGDWKVYNNANGNQAGTNQIIKTEGGCVIKEHWTDMNGNKGFSMNYYNGHSKKWRQIWVAAPGYVIDYEGGLNEDGAMVLDGYIQNYGSGNKQPFRGTWSKYPDGAVRQLFEIQGSEGNWQVWFDGKYVKQ